MSQYEKAVQRAVRRHSRSLPPFHRKNSTDDLAQEGRIGVVRAVRSHVPSKGALSTVVFPAISWRVADAVSKMKAEPLHRDREAIDTVSGDIDSGSDRASDRDDDRIVLRCEAAQDDEVHAHEVADAVRAFLDRLDPDVRGIARAIYWEGQTQAQVAARRGVSQPRVSAILRGVLQQGRRELAAFAA